MSRIFITGSADGLGLMAASLLVGQGHEVTAHARSEARARQTRAALPEAAAILTGDLSSIAATRSLAGQVNALGRYDAVIHNAGIGHRGVPRVTTEDGLGRTFAVNVLAPYLLTALITRPARLVYLSSGLAHGGVAGLADPQWTERPWDSFQAYSDSKLLACTLACAVARRWPQVRVNTVEPGWVPTKMGGSTATDDLSLGVLTQAWLAVSDDPAAKISGENLHHQQVIAAPPGARSVAYQDALLAYCADLTGTLLPEA